MRHCRVADGQTLLNVLYACTLDGFRLSLTSGTHWVYEPNWREQKREVGGTRGRYDLLFPSTEQFQLESIFNLMGRLQDFNESINFMEFNSSWVFFLTKKIQ